jgi:threonyl-tRNA synthetase
MAESVKQAVEAAKEGIQNLSVAGQAKPQGKKKEKKAGASSAQSEELQPPAKYIQDRLDLYDSIKAEYLENLAKKPHEDITVTFPDGKTRIGKSWETTPGEIARGISKSLYENTFIARVDGQLWDFERPLEKSCSLEFLNFDDNEAKLVRCFAVETVGLTSVCKPGRAEGLSNAKTSILRTIRGHCFSFGNRRTRNIDENR